MAALSRIDAKLDALLEHSGIKYDPLEHVHDEVVEALKRGDKIQAIKVYRAVTGIGLKEAKEYVEDVQRKADFDK